MSDVRGLGTSEIDEYLRGSIKFKGAYPCDQIPILPDNEYSLIINTDNSSLPGSHWTALVVRGNNVYYFDSFGRLYYIITVHFKQIILRIWVKFALVRRLCFKMKFYKVFIVIHAVNFAFTLLNSLRRMLHFREYFVILP